jgi:hypothetical protein
MVKAVRLAYAFDDLLDPRRPLMAARSAHFITPTPAGT